VPAAMATMRQPMTSPSRIHARGDVVGSADGPMVLVAAERSHQARASAARTRAG